MPSSSHFLQPTTLGTDPIELRMNSVTPTNETNNVPPPTKQDPPHAHRFIDFDEVANDLKKFADSFNSYATKKTFVTGFFNLALVG